jgi:hypothetical protein
VAESVDKGRCVNCGFLAKRTRRDQVNRASTPMYYEVEDHARESGEVSSYLQNPIAGPIGTEAFCFRNAADIKGEIDARFKEGDDDKRITLAVFEEDRKCTSWYRYNPGLSPKDHFDIMNMELLEKSRREWEMRLETERKDFDLKLFEASQKIQESNRQIAADSYKTARRSFWFTLFSTFVIVLLTLVTLLLTFLQVWLAMRQSGVPIPFPAWFEWLGFVG